jgi:Xaa-Pro aminopeptidase
VRRKQERLPLALQPRDHVAEVVAPHARSEYLQPPADVTGDSLLLARRAVDRDEFQERVQQPLAIHHKYTSQSGISPDRWPDTMVAIAGLHVAILSARDAMATDTRARIEEQLRMLPEDKLVSVLDFVSYLTARRPLRHDAEPDADYRAMAADEEHEREALEWIEAGPAERRPERRPLSEGMETALLSEPSLRKDWDTPEEDEIWAHL